MSLGKMNTFIDIIQPAKGKDGDGFSVNKDVLIASVRAYMEMRRGSKVWANRAVFSTADCLFRFRKIPGININTENLIKCGDERYNVLSVDGVRGRGMYVEILARKVEGSING